MVLTAANTLTDGLHTLSDVEIVTKPFAFDELLPRSTATPIPNR